MNNIMLPLSALYGLGDTVDSPLEQSPKWHMGTPGKRDRTSGKTNPAGMKMRKRSFKTSKRGCDGTLRG